MAILITSDLATNRQGCNKVSLRTKMLLGPGLKSLINLATESALPRKLNSAAQVVEISSIP
jgi:hypothetical protein